ncbi:MAG: LUD domain-containing protein, partial [Chloroflexota bacterium]|nr:LUD domain-containing protein [Chloroflexota bacterium]
PQLRPALRGHAIDLRLAEELEAQAQGPSDAAARMAGDVGIVLGRAGVAETGSFLSVEETLPARLLGMLADTVYALLPASSIVPSLDEIGRTLSQLTSQGTRYVSLVTGPSRTADIERVLTIGVQGPKVLHIIIVDDGQ